MHKFNIAMKFEEAIQKIQYGKCLLLTGAGFSLGAKNYKQDKSAFRIAKYIAHELYNECDVPKENQDEIYVERHNGIFDSMEKIKS